MGRLGYVIPGIALDVPGGDVRPPPFSRSIVSNVLAVRFGSAEYTGSGVGMSSINDGFASSRGAGPLLGRVGRRRVYEVFEMETSDLGAEAAQVVENGGGSGYTVRKLPRPLATGTPSWKHADADVHRLSNLLQQASACVIYSARKYLT